MLSLLILIGAGFLAWNLWLNGTLTAWTNGAIASPASIVPLISANNSAYGL